MISQQHLLLFVLALSSAATVVSGGFFGVAPTSAVPRNAALKPAVDEFAKISDKFLLDVQLDITGVESEGESSDDAKRGGHFPLTGLQLELLPDPVVDSDHPPLPGASSQHAALSTGARNLRVVKDASFIGMDGMKTADLNNGCWEMTWREGDPSGALVCGFDVPKEMKRNDNSPILPSGRIYITLRLWNDAGLDRMRKWRRAAEENHDMEMSKRRAELDKMQSTNNVFMKALHRTNSLAALDRAMATGVEGLIRDVPLDDALLKLEGGLMLKSDGNVAFEGETARSIIGKATVLPGGLRP